MIDYQNTQTDVPTTTDRGLQKVLVRCERERKFIERRHTLVRLFDIGGPDAVTRPRSLRMKMFRLYQCQDEYVARRHSRGVVDSSFSWG